MIELSYGQCVMLALLLTGIWALISFGVKRVWEKRGRPATYPTPVDLADFDIDYNHVAMRCSHYSEEFKDSCVLDADHNSVIENGTILHKGTNHQWLQPAIELPMLMRPMTFITLEDMWERNRRAFEAEQRASMSILRSARGYSPAPFQCNDRNPDSSYPYYCQKRTDHRDSVDKQTRRHGYAGVFWD